MININHIWIAKLDKVKIQQFNLSFLFHLLSKN